VRLFTPPGGRRFDCAGRGKLKRHLAIVFCLVCVGAPAGLAARPPRPQVFGPGVLSVGEVYRGSFAPDGRAFYFFKKVARDREDYRIFVARRVGGRWTAPERLALGGEYSDLYPAVSRDGKRLIFASYRPAPGDHSPKPNAHLWYVDRRGTGWGAPVFMRGVNLLGHYHSWVECGFDGAVYFRRTTPDWAQTETLVTRWRGGDYAPPARYEAVERWKRWRADVRVVGGSPGPDGKVIFLDVATRDPQTGRGASDIWVSFRRGQDWTEPKPLGPAINSPGYDVFPFFSPDGRTLYFVRDFAAFYHLPLRAALQTVRAE
jgi:hypothetical protein